MFELSVIVIGRNEETRIEQCLRSVFAALEDMNDYEVIYVDSASDDATVEIARKFPIQIYQLQPHWTLTPSAGRYIGYRHASGKFLAFVDGDTVLAPEWLKDSVEFLRSNPEFGGVAGILDKACLTDGGESEIIAHNYYEQPANGDVMPAGSLGGIATYSREAMEQAGTFNPYLPTGEECELALRLRRAGYSLGRIYRPMCIAHTLPPESLAEVMRRARGRLYDYGTPLRYCLRNGTAWRFSVEQMPFVYTFVGAVMAFAAGVVASLVTGAAWPWIVAVVAAAAYLVLKRRHPKFLAISALKRTIITYRTLVSFFGTKLLPVESYPTDVRIVHCPTSSPALRLRRRVAQSHASGIRLAEQKRKPIRIGAIVSMKMGLGQFIYRELFELAKLGATISVFPTKYRTGLYNPHPEWQVHRWRMWQVLLCQPWRFVAMPVSYLRGLATALRHRAMVDFLLASYFAPRVKQVDVLYATFGDRKFFVGYFAKLLTNTPLAVEIHAHEMYVSPNAGLFKIALEACDRIITVTEHNRRLLASEFGIAPERVEIVRYSVDMNEYRPAKKFVVLIVAFFVERKGHDILLQAVKQLDYDDVEVWVIGGPGGEAATIDVPELAKKLGIESQVAFFGKLSGAALKAVYHACDVFCLPCRHESNGNGEGFPTVLVEAMACGKPVITTQHVGIPEVVEEIVVEESDVDGLVAALRSVYASSTLRERMGMRNRELAEEHFSADNVARTMALLEQIAAPGERNSQVNGVIQSPAQISSGENGNPAHLAERESGQPPSTLASVHNCPESVGHSGAST